MSTRIQLRRGTAAQWASANPVLLAGEEGLETDTGKVKIGDGATAWAALKYRWPFDPSSVAITGGSIGGAGVAQIAASVSAVLVTPESYGAAGNGAADDTAALQSFITANRVSRLTPGSTYKITAPLVIPSSTVLIGYGATIALGAGANCRMLRTSSDVAGAGRNVSIAIYGGTWARGANGGTNNDSHSIFLRRVDGLEVRDVTVTSSAGKYAIAIGNCTRVVVDAIFLDTASDGIHLTGPISGCDISSIHGSTGDDTVAMTTKDFVSYSDTEGDIVDVMIRDVHATGTTRAVLLGCTAYNLKRISVRDVSQSGSGNGVSIGDGGTLGGTVDDVILDGVRAMAVGSRALRIAHSSVGKVDTRGLQSDGPAIEFSTEGAGCVVNTVRMQNCGSASSNAISINNATINVGSIRAEGLSSPTTSVPIFIASGTVGSLHASRMTGSSRGLATIASGAVVTAMTLDSINMSVLSGFNFLEVQGATLSSLRISNSAVSGGSTSDGSILKATISAILGNVFISNTEHSSGRVLLFTDATVTSPMKMFTNGVSLSGCNRVIEVATPITWTFANMQMASMLNQPIRIYGGASLTVRGQAFDGYTAGAIVRAGTEVIRVVASDLPCDLSILSKNNGDTALNTNGALSCGVGVASSNGSNWKNAYSGLIF